MRALVSLPSAGNEIESYRPQTLDAFKVTVERVSDRPSRLTTSLKFSPYGALLAQHDFANWRATKTSWPQRPCVADPFEFNLDHQPADLGLAAITALLLASGHVWPKADVLLSSGSYSDTIELIQGYPSPLQSE